MPKDEKLEVKTYNSGLYEVSIPIVNTDKRIATLITASEAIQWISALSEALANDDVVTKFEKGIYG